MLERPFPYRNRGVGEILAGTLMLFAGVGLTLGTYDAARSGGTYVVFYGLMGAGLVAIIRGLRDTFVPGHLRRSERGGRVRSRKERIAFDLVVGGALALVVVTAVVSTAASAVWANGLAVSTGLLLTIAVLLLLRAVATLVPAAAPGRDGGPPTPGTGLGAAIAATAGGVVLVALSIWRGAMLDRGELVRALALHAALVAGLALVAEGLTRWRDARGDAITRIRLGPGEEELEDPARRRRRMLVEIIAGSVLVLVGVGVTFATYTGADRTGGHYVLSVGPIVVGLALVVRAVTSGFKSFVAWRYLLVFDVKVTARAGIAVLLAIALVVYLALGWAGYLGPLALPVSAPVVVAVATFVAVTGAWGVVRHSRLAFAILCIGVALMLATMIAVDVLRMFEPKRVADDFLTDPDKYKGLRTALGYVSLAGGVIAALALFFGTLRAFFTFFTTVPIGGVWIGTAALVCVLSVMSGFETDLRDKILGSNAHIQITREDGPFTDWREVKARIDKIPGVVASTPYAVSEVVIAAHSNGMNVIIKGIDPATVGKVTDLINDLEDPHAIERLEPKDDDESERVVPQTPHPTGPGVVDPAPADLPNGGEPIDFSAPAAGTPEPVRDPAPDDLLSSSAGPEDFSGPDHPDDEAIAVVDIPSEASSSKRLDALPGVLVGRELVKQTHIFTGEEVRVVSPLSDPSNPDATGTPIPYNRDFRVAGVFFTGMYEYDLKYVYVTLDTLQEFLDRGDEIDGIEIRVADPDDTHRFLPTATSPGPIQEALGPGYRVADWRELNRSLFSALSIEKIGMFIVLGIVILVASFSIVGNLIMVVVEKAREIALLKTLGASDFAVTQLFAIQGLMIGVIGTVLGVATGLLGCWAGKRYGIPLNPDVYYIDRLPVHVEPVAVAAAALAGVIISILATLYPALLAARVRPAAGMRH